MAFFLLAFTSAVALLSWHLLCIYSNYKQACRIGLPIIIIPVNILNPVWILTRKWFAPLLKRGPFGLCNFDYTTLGWPFADKYSLHDRLGDAFVIVGPAENQVIVANAEAVEEIASQRKDFQKSEAMYKIMEVFGPNVNTVEGDTWQRHRRITTPPFNERNSNLVWRESISQAGDMLQSWMSASSTGGVTSTDSDTMTLALHVLTAAGFGKSYKFAGGLTKPADGHSMTYKEALGTILRSILLTIIINSAQFPEWMLPRKVVKVNEAIGNFKAYMTEMVEEERRSIANGEDDKGNLMSVLVRAAELSKADEKGRNSLTDEEIFGNLFIYNLAGHETTARTLAYAVALMSTNRGVQDWIGEELDAVFGPEQNVDKWQYEKAFPQLKRCLALMYETLRLYGPVVIIPKYTSAAHQTIKINEKEYTIPPKTYVILNLMALHSMPRHWGSDSLVWRPDRWIIPSQDENGLKYEDFFQPTPGSYVPWAHGPRICPGKKFSQVEFVAVVSCLLRRHRVEPKLLEGESHAQASERILKVVQDSDLVVMLKMKHPENVKLKWTVKRPEMGQS
jgi:cytochrome P450